MKISIYELLGMVKDGKTPTKIKLDGEIYERWTSEIDGSIDYKTFDNGFLSSYIGNNYLDCIREEVEIIEENKIPEKLPYYSMEKIQKAKNKDEWREERISLLEKRVSDLHIKMNDLLDYLKSKGE